MTYHISNATGLHLIHIAIGFRELSFMVASPFAGGCSELHRHRLSVTVLLVSSTPIRPLVRCGSASFSCDSLALFFRLSIRVESQLVTCIVESELVRIFPSVYELIMAFTTCADSSGFLALNRTEILSVSGTTLTLRLRWNRPNYRDIPKFTSACAGVITRLVGLQR